MNANERGALVPGLAIGRSRLRGVVSHSLHLGPLPPSYRRPLARSAQPACAALSVGSPDGHPGHCALRLCGGKPKHKPRQAGRDGRAGRATCPTGNDRFRYLGLHARPSYCTGSARKPRGEGGRERGSRAPLCPALARPQRSRGALETVLVKGAHIARKRVRPRRIEIADLSAHCRPHDGLRSKPSGRHASRPDGSRRQAQPGKLGRDQVITVKMRVITNSEKLPRVNKSTRFTICPAPDSCHYGAQIRSRRGQLT